MAFCERICQIINRMDTKITEYTKCESCNIYHAEPFCPLCTYKVQMKEYKVQMKEIMKEIMKNSLSDSGNQKRS